MTIYMSRTFFCDSHSLQILAVYTNFQAFEDHN